MAKIHGIDKSLIDRIQEKHKDSALVIGEAVLDAVLSNYLIHSNQYMFGINHNYRRREASLIEKSIEGLASDQGYELLLNKTAVIPETILEKGVDIWSIRYVVDVPFKLHEHKYDSDKISRFIGETVIDILPETKPIVTSLSDVNSEYQLLRAELTNRLNFKLGIEVPLK